MLMQMISPESINTVFPKKKWLHFKILWYGNAGCKRHCCCKLDKNIHHSRSQLFLIFKNSKIEKAFDFRNPVDVEKNRQSVFGNEARIVYRNSWFVIFFSRNGFTRDYLIFSNNWIRGKNIGTGYLFLINFRYLSPKSTSSLHLVRVWLKVKPWLIPRALSLTIVLPAESRERIKGCVPIKCKLMNALSSPLVKRGLMGVKKTKCKKIRSFAIFLPNISQDC